MVKVIGDGKEYEFEKVHVTEYDERNVGWGVSLARQKDCYTDFISKEKPKQEFVSVPKEIQFMGWGSDDPNLVITKNEEYLKLLQFDNTSWFITNYDTKLNSLSLIDCVLVPTKREDLKAGDWAFGWYATDVKSAQFERRENYFLILNEHKEVRCEGRMYMGTKEQGYHGGSHVEVKELCYPKDAHWFKVVPRSDVE